MKNLRNPDETLLWPATSIPRNYHSDGVIERLAVNHGMLRDYLQFCLGRSVVVFVHFFHGMSVTGRGKISPRSVVDAKRQIRLTSNYILRKILRFSGGVACVESVVLEAISTYSANKQKVRHFRNCFDFVY